MIWFYYILAILLVIISLYHFIVARNYVKRLIALNILGSGVFLFFITTAKNTNTESPDPVPHALVLTGIVVAVSATAIAVSLILHLNKEEE
ncbi:MAG: cation:proton antiporter subunit C [Pyrobaculum arsenaticum]|uniref:Na+/H+ antiporter subunit C n=1 Tax=Hydrogenobacter sp. TaxID=2152829 RepID=A0A7C2ZDZ4_9AQUI|nr:cation:proton antiporter subunit C [Pyrobaculum arsenaticum]MDM7266750.1 cation:proton antiporter subunit C [Aquificaceae bacterium]HAV40562.1 Na+/H+ antiporter subunit C [Aquificaceae bacterium]HCO39629.1 Na+/H+ antiporter subunit C [Aquificaceae bacterium]